MTYTSIHDVHRIVVKDPDERGGTNWLTMQAYDVHGEHLFEVTFINADGFEFTTRKQEIQATPIPSEVPA